MPKEGYAFCGEGFGTVIWNTFLIKKKKILRERYKWL